MKEDTILVCLIIAGILIGVTIIFIPAPDYPIKLNSTTTLDTNPSGTVPYPYKETHTVIRVIDGDTIEIEEGERVRLICIDAPEEGKERYNQSRTYLTNLVLGKEVLLVKDVSDMDSYGRLLRYVYIGDMFVNEEMVISGHAEVFPYGPDTKECDYLEKAYIRAIK